MSVVLSIGVMVLAVILGRIGFDLLFGRVRVRLDLDNLSGCYNPQTHTIEIAPRRMLSYGDKRP